MRGFLTPSVSTTLTDHQKTYQALARHRRVKVAAAANTNLVKADQWARGDGATKETAAALDTAVKSTVWSKKK